MISEPRRTTFAERYPSPVFSEPRATGVPGISWVSVYDRSELAADPIRPSNWLRAAEQTFATDDEGVLEALTAVGFVPANEREAIAAAELSILQYGTAGLVEAPTDAPLARVPADVAARVTGKPVRREGEGFVVSLFYLHPAILYAGRQITGASLVRFDVTIATGCYRARSHQLWRE